MGLMMWTFAQGEIGVDHPSDFDCERLYLNMSVFDSFCFAPDMMHCILNIGTYCQANYYIHTLCNNPICFFKFSAGFTEALG